MIPYFSRPLIARSLALVAPTWTGPDGRWGVIEETRMGPYAEWFTGDTGRRLLDRLRRRAATSVPVPAE